MFYTAHDRCEHTQHHNDSQSETPKRNEKGTYKKND